MAIFHRYVNVYQRLHPIFGWRYNSEDCAETYAIAEQRGSTTEFCQCRPQDLVGGFTGTWLVFFPGWWFGTFYIFPYIRNSHPNWLIFFRGFETTNQFLEHDFYILLWWFIVGCWWINHGFWLWLIVMLVVFLEHDWSIFPYTAGQIITTSLRPKPIDDGW